MSDNRWDARASILGRGRYFSLLHRVQTGSGVHQPSYPMGTSTSFPGCKAAEALSWSLNAWSYTSTLHTSSWCGA
jgi:hypothetical protein